jgi:hypothetical protein
VAELLKVVLVYNIHDPGPAILNAQSAHGLVCVLPPERQLVSDPPHVLPVAGESRALVAERHIPFVESVTAWVPPPALPTSDPLDRLG